ncbi:MAG: galactose mutarotase [Bacteroidales bacterium]|nr:galactose mutarotase [Bacteroidales bacterium]
MKKLFLPFLALFVAACSTDQGVKLIPELAFQTEIDGKEVSIYTLQGGGLTAQITNYGARVVSLWAPDRDGCLRDVVIGRASIDDYINGEGERFLGACVGPVANRIGGASFSLDGVEYVLDKNDGDNTLHGGFVGIDRLVWDVVEQSESSIKFQVVHPDGLGGFPGNKTISVRYTLTSQHDLKVEFEATTDAPTPINLAHHPFFNLKGSGEGDILGHEMQILASGVSAVDENLIPLGRTVIIDGGPLDFRKPRPIGQFIDADDEQLRNGHGYDHNWIIDIDGSKAMSLDARVHDPVSGRILEVYSDQPGLQFYSGNFFGDGKTVDQFGNTVAYRGAFALETQKFPDAVHFPQFPDTILRPGDVYKHTCLYRLTAE